MSFAEVDSEPTLPNTLAILPLKDRVLLPSSATKLVLTSRRSLALVDHLLSASSDGPGNMYVGVVPLRRDVDSDPEATAVAAAAHAAGGGSGRAGGANAHDLNADAPPGHEEDEDENAAHHHAGPDAADIAAMRSRCFDVGAAARIVQITRGDRPVRSYTLLLECRCRFQLDDFVTATPFIVANVRQLDSLVHSNGLSLGGPRGGGTDLSTMDAELHAMATSFKEQARELVDKLEHRKGHARRLKSMLEYAPAHRLADLFVAAFEDSFDARLEVLATTCPKERMKRALALMESQLHAVTVSSDINKRVEGRLSKTQREYLLRQQMQAIREELGEGEGGNEEDDLEQLQAKLHASEPPPEILKAAESELRKLRKMTEQAPAYGITRSWIEVIASLPWSKEAATDAASTEVAMTEARAVLDEDHYGLDKVKDRIIEYLAVRRLRPEARPPILCFLGPPGVGKTTLARSIAKVLNRPFQRISLGGVRDEADIRGHRRTYIASMPGRLIQALRRVGVRDPVLLLDELDKMGADSRGDPAAAMLEVLDPEQNNAFTDHYLGLPFDLSRVTFLATANDARTIPGPLWDRMEMIEVPGYTAEEKHRIAMKHVVPRVLEEHGLLDPLRLRIPPEAVETVVRSYTREAGVRGLQRCLASLCRSVAVHVAHEGDVAAAATGSGSLSSAAASGFGARAAAAGVVAEVLAIGADGIPIVTQELIQRVLGPARYDGNNDLKQRGDLPGVVAGLSWTAVGGDLMYIEAAAMPGRGELQLTGQLGDVIKESALIAMSWVQSNAHALGLNSPPGSKDTAGGAGGGRGGLISGGGGGGVEDEAVPPGMYAADTMGAPGAGAGVVDASSSSSSRTAAAITDPVSGGDGLLAGRSVHIHLPQGAIPKDGPSAGVTMSTALVSLFSERPVRCDTAMTGEVSLRGLVLPVGGIKEKLIAAHQNGITRVLIPARNVSDVEHEVPAETRAALDIIPCVTMADVLENAFDGGYRLRPDVGRAKM